MGKRFFIDFGLVLLVIGGLLFFGHSHSFAPSSSLLQRPTPTPMPFYSLTIPALRNRSYTSSIGTPTQDYSGAGYTAFLTSFTSDGYTVNALLTKPTGVMPAGGWSAIVFVHGYIPPQQYVTDGTAYSTYVDYLARNGFVVLKIDLRGNGNSQGVPGGAYYSSDYVIDTLNAYAALQKSGFVNPKEIGLWGHSMAGNVVMRAFAVKPTIPAVVIWAGAVYSYVDQRKYGLHDNSYQPNTTPTSVLALRKQLTDTYGSPSATSVFWNDMAPTSFLRDLKGAIEIHHAIDDNVVSIWYSRDLIALLDKTTVKHEYFEYPTGGHNISGSSFYLAMQRTVQFYKKYLEGK